MMDVNKVQILVQEGEGLTVEFKEHFTRDKRREPQGQL